MNTAENNTTERKIDKLSITVAFAGLLAMGATGVMNAQLGGGWHIAFLLSQVVVISLIIWQACDPFAEAAQWIGMRFHLPGSVRGATLDAIASSMPELFSGIFFVVVAVSAAGDTQEAIAQAGSDGMGPTVATCAGSAVYNMILIPAICALVISFTRKNRPTIDVAPTVILRDGLWFLACEFLLIVFLFQAAMYWWMGVVLLVIYAIYIRFLYSDAQRFRRAMLAVRHALGDQATSASPQQIDEVLRAEGKSPSRALIAELHSRLTSLALDGNQNDSQDDHEDAPAAAQVLFGLFEVPLSMVSAWGVILVSTLVAAASCYWLVEVTWATAKGLDVPIFFVAVILAAAASSVPDTFLSVGAARRGDDDGAVSNAFGSNIFDICVCLSIPLLVCSWLSGWQPISLTQDGQPMPGLVGIRILLCLLTVVTLLIMWHNQQLTRRKAYVLCALYGVFILYAVAGSLGYTLDQLLS
jgi:Ca2+/Na+ antiporter